ncbi:MAG: thioredoxin fold domain-containing protein [Burkholderiaceae bacterium]
MKRRAFLHRTVLTTVFCGAGLTLAGCEKAEAPIDAPVVTPLPATLPSVSRQLLAEQGRGFSVGAPDSTTVVYVFFDPQCPHCASLWKTQQAFLGQARFVWMPVGLIRSASRTQGATILAAADPVAAMSEHEAQLSPNGSGGISVDRRAVDAFGPVVDKNTALFERLGLRSVPHLYVSRPGRTLVEQRGAPAPARLQALLSDPPPSQ